MWAAGLLLGPVYFATSFNNSLFVKPVLHFDKFTALFQ